MALTWGRRLGLKMGRTGYLLRCQVWNASMSFCRCGLPWRCRVLLILAFALTPAFASAISVDEGKLEQIGLAMLNYESSFRHFPAEFISSGGTALLSWRVAILPFLGPQAAALYSAFDLTKPWNDPANLPLLQQIPDAYRSPLDPAGTTVTRYAGGSGPTGGNMPVRTSPTCCRGAWNRARPSRCAMRYRATRPS